MTKIKFGYNNFDVLTPLCEGSHIIPGEFLDYIAVSDRNYMISELQDEEKRIDVREVVQDLYANGSIKVYANNYKTSDTNRLEEILNSRYVKKDLAPFGVASVLRDNGLCVQDSNFVLPDEDFTVISIDEDLFNATRLALRGTHYSFAQLVARVNVLEAEKREETNKLSK